MPGQVTERKRPQAPAPSTDAASYNCFGMVGELLMLAAGGGPHGGRHGGLEDMAQSLLDGGASEVVIKDGAAGATAYSAGQTVSVPARKVAVADVVGAGDAFVAGYLSGYLDGADTEAKLNRGVTTAAFAIARHGDWEGLPTRAELALLDLPPGTTMR